MELTYKVRADDGNEYGPATLVEINAWLREGRLNGQNQVTRSDIDYWSPAANFSELEVAKPAGPPELPQVRAVAASSASPVRATGVRAVPVAAAAGRSDPVTEAHLKSGANWFYWIAGLSLVNSLVALSGNEWGFILGLGITQAIDGFGRNLEGGGKAVVLLLDLAAMGVFVLFGVFANKRHTWAFVVGMILYALDGLLFLLAQDWLGLGFHVFALYCLFRGFKCCRELNSAS